MAELIVQKNRRSLDSEPAGFVTRFDGARVATSTLDRVDLMFMAAEEESRGNVDTATELRALAERRSTGDLRNG
jgi:hypothetical protein